MNFSLDCDYFAFYDDNADLSVALTLDRCKLALDKRHLLGRQGRNLIESSGLCNHNTPSKLKCQRAYFIPLTENAQTPRTHFLSVSTPRDIRVLGATSLYGLPRGSQRQSRTCALTTNRGLARWTRKAGHSDRVSGHAPDPGSRYSFRPCWFQRIEMLTPRVGLSLVPPVTSVTVTVTFSPSRSFCAMYALCVLFM